MDILRIEHHENFTAVYLHGNIALMCYEGTIQQRRAVNDERWYTAATIAAPTD